MVDVVPSPVDELVSEAADVDDDDRQSLRRVRASPFITQTTSLRGFVFDVATGTLGEITG